MKTYTVVGLYIDSYQRYAEAVEATSAEEAELKVNDWLDDECFVVAGVFEGELEAVA